MPKCGAIQNPTGNQWFKVDLGASRAFDRIALDTEASPGDNPRSYEVHVSTDNQDWTKVAGGMDSGLVTYISFPLQNARWVRVTQIGTTTWNWWSIHEFNVYAPNNAPQFTGASSSSASENAFDGIPDTRWTSNDWQKPGQWLEVDMRSKKSFNKVILDAAGSSNDYPPGYTVEVSNDREAWNEIASGGRSACHHLRCHNDSCQLPKRPPYPHQADRDLVDRLLERSRVQGRAIRRFHAFLCQISAPGPGTDPTAHHCIKPS